MASKYGMNEERTKEAAFFSNGNMLDALSGIEQVGKGEFDLFIDWLEKLIRASQLIWLRKLKRSLPLVKMQLSKCLAMAYNS